MAYKYNTLRKIKTDYRWLINHTFLDNQERKWRVLDLVIGPSDEASFNTFLADYGVHADLYKSNERKYLKSYGYEDLEIYVILEADFPGIFHQLFIDYVRQHDIDFQIGTYLEES